MIKKNRSVERSIEILKLISSNQEGVTLGEIQEKLLLPKTSAYDIVKTLLELEMISVIEKGQQHYVIGLESFRIGLSYEKDMLIIIKKHLKTLSEKLNKTIFLGLLKDGEVVYLDKREPISPIVTTATLGTRNPVHCTALGKAILFDTTSEKIKKILEKKGMERKTQYTITNIEEYIKHIEEWKIKGYALDNREIEENQLCIAAPIYDSRGKIVAALSASGFYNPDEDIEKAGLILKEITLLASKELGHRVRNK